MIAKSTAGVIHQMLLRLVFSTKVAETKKFVPFYF